jgi:hypothetical protein
MAKDLPNYHLIVVSYLGATNSRGSRIKLTSMRFGDSVLLSYDYSFNQAKDQAIQYLNNLGFDPIGAGYDEKKGDSIIICKTFNSLKETKKIKR